MRIFKQLILSVLVLMGISVQSQIGIGTINPEGTSILDVTSTTQGFLTPRMTTTQRNAITNPANGLMVFDTSVGSFYYYNFPATSWVKLNGDKDGRLKYKLLKSGDVLANVLAVEKANGSGTTYKLDTNTLYEINGTITLDLPIEINNAYIIGLDSGEDKLIKPTGDLFTGTTGGSVRVLTLQATSGNVFNVTGTGSIAAGTQTQSIVLRDCIVTTSNRVGKIENFALVFISIVQYVGNTNGIVYKDINKLLLSNSGWFGNNNGIYEKLEGTFGLMTKQGGFSEVIGTNIGFDVSANPVINGNAVIESTVFTGTLGTGKYVNGYSPATYTGFNFNNNWSVISPGIQTEGDSQSTGTVYFNQAVTTQPATSLPSTGANTKLTISGGLNSNLFRSTASNDGRITYVGKKGRIFQVNCAISFENVSGLGNTEYAFFFMKIPSTGPNEPQTPSESLIDTNAGYIQSFPIQGSIFLNSGDSVEVWFRKLNSSTQNFRVRSFNMTMK